MAKKTENETYKAAFHAVIEELDDILQERDRLQERLNRLLTTAVSLQTLLGEEVPDRLKQIIIDNQEAELGFTETIRKALAESARPLTPTEVRDALLLMRYDLSGYSNPIAAIHTVLKRLVEQDEADTQLNAAGKMAYYSTKAKAAFKPVIFKGRG